MAVARYKKDGTILDLWAGAGFDTVMEPSRVVGKKVQDLLPEYAAAVFSPTGRVYAVEIIRGDKIFRREVFTQNIPGSDDRFAYLFGKPPLTFPKILPRHGGILK